jgi:hypothetical protein
MITMNEKVTNQDYLIAARCARALVRRCGVDRNEVIFRA